MFFRMDGRRNLMAEVVPCHGEEDRPSPRGASLSHGAWRGLAPGWVVPWRDPSSPAGAAAFQSTQWWFPPAVWRASRSGLTNAAAHASTLVRRRPPQPRPAVCRHQPGIVCDALLQRLMNLIGANLKIAARRLITFIIICSPAANGNLC